jgi:homoserine dehydrogenase
MGAQLRLEDVQREGIRTLDAEMVQRARSEGRPFKLVARANRVAKETVIASVGPEQVPISHPFATISGSSLIVHFELDVLLGLSLIAHRPNLQSTAYGLLADFINAVR